MALASGVAGESSSPQVTEPKRAFLEVSMLLRSDPRITSAMTSDALALPILDQLHVEMMRTSDPNVLAITLGQYTAIATARAARRGVAPLPSAVSNPYEQFRAQTSLRDQLATQRLSKMMATISNILKTVQDEADNIITNMK